MNDPLIKTGAQIIFYVALVVLLIILVIKKKKQIHIIEDNSKDKGNPPESDITGS